MGKIRFALVGSGWRARFYLRIAAALPERFEVAAVLVRTPEKQAVFAAEYGVPVVRSMDALCAAGPDFAVVAVNKASIFEVARGCAARGLAVLTETPPAFSEADLHALWQLAQEGAKLLVAEQYPFLPYYVAVAALAKRGLLGTPDTALLSDAHDYHAAALARRLLGAGMQPVSVSGGRFTFPLVETGSRAGVVIGGAPGEQWRTRLTLAFEDGALAFYDFSGAQYHSRIRSRHFALQGVCGEIWDDDVRWVDEAGAPQRARLETVEEAGCVREVRFQGDLLYRYPWEAPLPPDEAAVAQCLVDMAGLLRGREPAYPLREALQDAYLSLLMHRAAESGASLRSAAQPWQ